jgi:serine/threonine protein phosphatase PrpC
VQEAFTEASASGKLDATEKGSTATIVLKLPNSLSIVHLGDSRAAVFTEAETKLEANFITSDYKPSQQEERSRINQHG